MSAALPTPVPLPARRDGAPGRPRDWRSAVPLLSLLAVALLVTAVEWSLSSERAALRRLPAEERAALVLRTVSELRASCGAGRPDVLKSHCHELASFAAGFEECRGECAELVHRELTPVPTR